MMKLVLRMREKTELEPTVASRVKKYCWLTLHRQAVTGLVSLLWPHVVSLLVPLPCGHGLQSQSCIKW